MAKRELTGVALAITKSAARTLENESKRTGVSISALVSAAVEIARIEKARSPKRWEKMALTLEPAQGVVDGVE